MKTIKKLYQSKNWKISIIDEFSIKIWERQPDKTWKPRWQIWQMLEFNTDKVSYFISDDIVTDDNRQTHQFFNASDEVMIQYHTGAPVTKRHLEILDACILAKNLSN